MTLIDFDWAFKNPHLWRCSPPQIWERHKNQECRDVHYGVPWPPDDSATWPFWCDALGEHLQPGDYVAIATVSGRSPTQLVAEVKRINRKNSRGELIRGTHAWETLDGKLPDGMHYRSPNKPHEVRLPGCTVTARSFYSRFSYGRSDRDSTYSFVENIIRLDPSQVQGILHQQKQTPIKFMPV